MRAICTVAVVVWIVVVSGLASMVWFWLLPAIFLLLAGLFVWNGLYKVPAKDYPKKGDKHPYRGILMFLGKRREIVLDEGWDWVPLRPFLFDVLLVDVEKKIHQFGPQNVRTPDNMLISTSEAVVWRPGIDGVEGSYITYLNSGGEAGVKQILRERVEDRVKTWGSSNQEGPATWKEAQGLRDDAHAVLAKALLGGVSTGGALTEVDSDIPTGTWMRFLNAPKSPPTEYDKRPENGWASVDATGRWNWDGLQDIFDGYSSECQAELRSQVRARKREVDELRGARGNFADRSLGITILGFTVNEIEGKGPAAVAAAKAEQERLEADADKVEIQNVSDRATVLKTNHPDLTSEKAFEIVQVEREKVGKTIIAVSGAQTAFGQDGMAIAKLWPGGGITPMAAASGRDDKSRERSPAGRGRKPERMSDEEADKYLDRFIAGENVDDDDDDEEEEEKK